MNAILGDRIPLVVLSGPSHAEEVAQGIPTLVVAASENTEVAAIVQETFRDKYFRVYVQRDVVGVELGGALKNVIAIAAGISDGLGYGLNTRAALITRGLAEITRLGVKLGAHPLTFSGLGGLGDLVLTCTGSLSRNRTVGLKLGEGRTLEQALADGKASLNLRYRFESVSDDAFADDGYASTLRAALGYATGRWHNLSATVEIQSVLDLGYENRHNDKGAGSDWNGVSDRPVIADPSITDFYQAYLQWQASPTTTLRAGRQAILLDNVRFVGNVGWRQFHQSFDALKITTKPVPGVRLTYAYIWNQNRIFGDSRKMGTHLLNLGGKLSDHNTLKGYAYLVDYDRLADSGASTLTIGLHDEGAVPFESWKLLYDVEIAKQSDAGDNPGNVDAWYYRAGVGGKFGGFTAKLTYEVLEGEPGKGAFSTPLATLHAWNGWADIFLKTPANGLEDFYLTIAYKTGGWKLAAIYHDFSADTGGAHYGNELDLVASWKSSWKQVFALKAAMYDADEYARDVSKLWAYTSWKF